MFPSPLIVCVCVCMCLWEGAGGAGCARWCWRSETWPVCRFAERGGATGSVRMRARQSGLSVAAKTLAPCSPPLHLILVSSPGVAPPPLPMQASHDEM